MNKINVSPAVKKMECIYQVKENVYNAANNVRHAKIILIIAHNV